MKSDACLAVTIIAVAALVLSLVGFAIHVGTRGAHENNLKVRFKVAQCYAHGGYWVNNGCFPKQ